MLYKKHMLALVLSISFAGINADFQQSASDILQNIEKKINLSELKEQLIDNAQNWQDAIKNFAKNKDLTKLNFAPAVAFLKENIGNIADTFENVLEFIKDQKYTQDIRAELKNMRNLKQHLETVERYANLDRYNGLVSEKFKQVKKALDDNMSDVLKQINKISYANIQDALKQVSEYLQGNDIDINKLAEGIGEVRKKIAPAIPALIQGLSAALLELNKLESQAEQMSPEVQNVFKTLKNAAASIQKAIDNINPKITTAISQAMSE
jgi:hypothetical protein